MSQELKLKPLIDGVKASSEHVASGLPVTEISTEQLFGDEKMIFILHLGERYLLSITKQSKLLLTKVKHQL